MSICHISCKTVSHSSGRTAPAAAAYRAGDRIKNEMDGRTHDYSRKGGVAHAEIIVPAGTPTPTRAELWNAAEKADKRKNSVVAREWEVALPCELSSTERKALALEFGRWLCATYGVVADVAIHAPNKRGDQRNHHAHILTTTRTWDGHLGAKTRILDTKETGAKEVAKVRKEWERLCNRALERAGRDERISAGRLPKGEIATIHVGVAATAVKRKGGEVSSREQHNDQVRELRELEAALAAAKAAEQQPAAPAEEPEPPEEKSEMEKRRDALLADPLCKDAVRALLTEQGWEDFVPILEEQMAEMRPRSAAAEEAAIAVAIDETTIRPSTDRRQPSPPRPDLVDRAMGKILPGKPKPKTQDAGRGGWSR